MTASNDDSALREQALERLKKKRDFSTHALVYLAVNLLLVLIWAVATGGFFWPVFSIAGWGIGLIFHARDVYGGQPTEAQIQEEMSHLGKR